MEQDLPPENHHNHPVAAGSHSSHSHSPIPTMVTVMRESSSDNSEDCHQRSSTTTTTSYNDDAGNMEKDLIATATGDAKGRRESGRKVPVLATNVVFLERGTFDDYAVDNDYDVAVAAQYRTPERVVSRARQDLPGAAASSFRDAAAAAVGGEQQLAPISTQGESFITENNHRGDYITTTTTSTTFPAVNMAKTPEKGDLDNYLGVKDTSVRGVTIQTGPGMPSSPDKTTSTVSWSASPDFIADFPEAKSRSAVQNNKHPSTHIQFRGECSDNVRPNHQHQRHRTELVPPPEKQHRLSTMTGEEQEEPTNSARDDVRTLETPHSVAGTSYPATSVATSDLLRIQIETSPRPIGSKDDSNHTRNPYTFYVPVSLMLQREIEMQEAARINHIGQDRWSTSRIFRMWRKQQQQQQQQQEKKTHTISDMTIHLTPEISLQNSSSSCSNFRWKSWLTTCIRAFYNTGSLRIPESCQGDDILLALEYFGILTASSEMFVFESPLAFERIQSWSRYFSFRTELAETLLEAYDDAEEEEECPRSVGSGCEDDEIDHDQARAIFLRSSFKARIWVLREADHEGAGGGGAQELWLVEGAPARELPVRAESGLYGLFCGVRPDYLCHDDDEDYQLTRLLPVRLRLDFCEYVRQSLPPRTAVFFHLEKVETIVSPSRGGTSGSKFETIPVIRIEANGEKSIRNTQVHDVTAVNGGLTKENQESSLRSASIGSTRDRLDAAATSRASTNGSEARWKISETSTHHSPHTKTLDGEGIFPVPADLFSNTSPLAKKVLFLDDQQHKQPLLREVVGEGHQQWNFQINPREISNDLTSPNSLRVNRQDSGLTDANVRHAKLQCSETKQSENKTCKESAPVSFINTEFGDLQSVTSMLSEPVIDTPGAVCGMRALHSVSQEPLIEARNQVIAREQEKRKLAEAAKRIIQSRALDDTKSSERHRNSVSALPEELQQGANFSNPLDDASPGKLLDTSLGNQEASRETRRVSEASDYFELTTTKAQQLENPQHHDLALEAKSPVVADDPFASWGNILASVCEAVIPAPPSNVASSSPTRTFQVVASESHLTNHLSSRTNGEQDDPPFAGCPCRQDQSAVFEENGSSRWVPGPQAPDVAIERADAYKEHDHDEFLDRARQVGREISDQFDAFMKMAFEATEDVERATGGMLSVIPEESPNVIPPISVVKPLEITTKKNFSYAVPKSQSFDSDALAEASVPLPPHHSRRSRSKMTLARKKNSPNRPQPRHVVNSRLHEERSRTTKEYQVGRRDQSLSSLSDVSSRRVPEQPKDNRKMLL